MGTIFPGWLAKSMIDYSWLASYNSKNEFSLYLYQRWSPRGRPWPRGRPRGHILKSLALASKVKSLALASRPQVLENWPVLGSRTSLFFGMLKILWSARKIFWKTFFSGDRLKNFCGDLFFCLFFFCGDCLKNFCEDVFFFFFFGDRLKNFCEDLFFFFGEHLRFVSLVLGLGLESVCPRSPWPWPRIFFVSLALRPRALCPRLHLWFVSY